MAQAQAPRRPRHGHLLEALEPRRLCATGELIRNGSLEGVIADADWTRAGLFQADSRFTNLHSGLGYAYLSATNGSGANSISGSMSQSLTIPAAAEQLKLSFWTKITTSETSTSAKSDVMTIDVTNAAGTASLQRVATLSNLDASTNYVKRTFTLNNALKGQSVRLVFNASTNASLPTVFRIDDIGLSTKLPDTAKKIVGYLPSYRQGLFAQMNLDYVTHLNYFAIKANNDGSLNIAGVNDANLATVVNAAHAKGVGVSITIGPQTFGTVAASAAARATFAQQIVNYCVARNLDGIDIDWEPPATGQNYANYALLLQAIYDKSAPLGLKLSAATNPWTQEIPVAATHLMDWVNVMCYDFHYADNSTYAAAIDGMIQWSDYGVEKHKLLMGTPFYGRGGTSWSNTKSKTYAAFYNEYAALHGQPPAAHVDSFVDPAGVTWFVNGQRTIQRKMAWVRDNGYGGAMIWELGQDRWDGSNKYDQASLLPAINSMLRPPAWLAPAPGSMFNFHNKQLTLAAGNVTFVGNAHATDPGVRLVINDGASAAFNTTQRLASLVMSGSGKLDLRTHALALDYAGNASPIGAWDGAGYTGASGMVAAGRDHDAGVYSSLDDGLYKMIGVAEARDALGLTGGATALWNGQTVDATTVLLKYTYAGDANLNGRVNAADYAWIDAHAAAAPSAWLRGDFNLDGYVDGGDYAYIDIVVSAQGAPL